MSTLTSRQVGSRHGYFPAGAPLGEVHMIPGQKVAGFPVGVIYIPDVWYPMVPGNVVNGSTFDFPVRLKPVEGLDIPTLFGENRRDVFEEVLAACLELQREGVRAISSGCGFFGQYQARIAAQMDIPVGLSPLIQIPWLRTILPGRKIAIITADSSSLTDMLWEGCGVTDTSDLLIRGLQDEAQFSVVLEGRGTFDNDIVTEEVVSAARELCADPEVGSVLFECSDLPPYAWAVQNACGMPVFDFTTLINWLRLGGARSPFGGWI